MTNVGIIVYGVLTIVLLAVAGFVYKDTFVIGNVIVASFGAYITFDLDRQIEMGSQSKNIQAARFAVYMLTITAGFIAFLKLIAFTWR